MKKQELAPAVHRETLRDLKRLLRAGILKKFYLAGGTGLAFILGHRESRDLDFFRKAPFNERSLVEDLRRAGKFSLEKREPGTVRGYFGNTLVSFFHYPYPLLKKPIKKYGIQIASVFDIGCMKLDAISSRGTKRDFIDVYTILRESDFNLKKLLGAFAKKYAVLRYNLMHVKKSLVYFTDAQRDPMPRMRLAVEWRIVKKFFINEVKKL